jgi:hypothetical protein
MSFEALRDNVRHMKEVLREIYVFTNQLEVIKNLETSSNIVINTKEKQLLTNTIQSLTNQLRILNNSLPKLVQRVGFYKQLDSEAQKPAVKKEKFVQVQYKPEINKQVSLTIEDKDKKVFLDNLAKSSQAKGQLKQKYSVSKPTPEFGKPNQYAKISNRFFRNYSNKLIVKGHFRRLNEDLRKINSPFVLGTYVSMILFTGFISFVGGLFLFLMLLFFDISPLFPFISFADEAILIRTIKFFWIVIIAPAVAGFLVYAYPASESKNLGKKIDQELPFVTIHMSAIATSGVEPLSIFKIVLKSKEYKYSNIAFRKSLIFPPEVIVVAKPSNKSDNFLEGELLEVAFNAVTKSFP